MKTGDARTVSEGLIAMFSVVPISEANVPPIIGWYATAVDDDSEDDLEHSND